MIISDYPFKEHFPSEKYWDIVKTKGDYLKFVGSGMAWEWEPNCPATWTEHKRLKVQLGIDRSYHDGQEGVV